jgi:hypothetical protein
MFSLSITVNVLGGICCRRALGSHSLRRGDRLLTIRLAEDPDATGSIGLVLGVTLHALLLRGWFTARWAFRS